MKYLLCLFVVFRLALGATAAAADDAGDELESRIAASRTVARAFAETLKEHLVSAMGKGGPINAIRVCNTAAPAVANDISLTHGWQVGRTSLKYRNPDNAPDAWETSVLTAFEDQVAAGAEISALEKAEIVHVDGKSEFRYMKPIPTQSVCLTCHGQQLAPDLAAAIDELYPNDLARGFAVGDIRGAFTIRQPIAE